MVIYSFNGTLAAVQGSASPAWKAPRSQEEAIGSTTVLQAVRDSVCCLSPKTHSGLGNAGCPRSDSQICINSYITCFFCALISIVLDKA